MTADEQQYGDVLQAYKWLREGKVVQRKGETKIYRLRKDYDTFALERKWLGGGGWDTAFLTLLHDADWLSDRWMVVGEGTA